MSTPPPIPNAIDIREESTNSANGCTSLPQNASTIHDQGSKSWNDIAEQLGFASPIIVCTDYLPSLIRQKHLDEYLVFLGVFLSFRSDDLVVIKPPLKGWLEYVQSLGFANDVFIEDTESQLLDRDFDWSLLPDRTLITNYPQAHHPRTLVTQKVQELADSKASLHGHAEEFAVPILKGGAASCWRELVYVIENIEFPLYLKRDGGSGGDYVCKADSWDEVPSAVEYLLGAACPEHFGSSLIAEQDGYLLDNRAINFNLSAVLTPSQQLILGFSTQTMRPRGTGKLEWWGSRRWDPSIEQRQAIEVAFAPLADYWRSLGYMGPVGPDGLFIHTEEGWEVRWFDLNARFPISFYARMIANAFQYRQWRNVNVTLPFVAKDFDQVRNAGLDREGIVWMAFRSVHGWTSPACKIFLGGNTEEEVDGLVHFLLSKDVEIGS